MAEENILGSMQDDTEWILEAFITESREAVMENIINFAKQKTSTEPLQHFMLQKLGQVNYIFMRISDQLNLKNPQSVKMLWV